MLYIYKTDHDVLFYDFQLYTILLNRCQTFGLLLIVTV